MSADEIDRVAERVADRLDGLLRPGPPRLLKYSEAAEMLSCHENTVRGLVEVGELVPTMVTDRAPRLAEDQLARFVRRRTVLR